MEDHSESTTLDRDVPPQVADALRVALDLSEPPATLGDWAAAAARLLDESGVTVGLDGLCTAESSRHAARVGDGVRQFHCVLDALLLPFVVDDQEEFRVESRCPVSGEVVDIVISRDGVEATPLDAVMSFGVAADFEPPADGTVSPALAYESVCPYINAFPSRTAYEQWAGAGDADAVTMAFPLTEGFALARTLAEDATE